MSKEPYEVEHVEYVDAEPLEPQATYAHPHIQPMVYQSDGLPCCSGCGCISLLLMAMLFSGAGSIFTGILVLITAIVLATAAMRMAGVRRWSPAYVYIMVPLFLICVNLAAKLFRGEFPYSLAQIIGATLIIYVVLYLARALGRK